jgi:hypothetical protein
MGQRRTSPFTPTEVTNLNDFQNSGVWHAFRCANEPCACLLVATEAGWICPQCSYTQDWAHAWMVEGTWRGSQAVLRREG